MVPVPGGQGVYQPYPFWVRARGASDTTSVTVEDISISGFPDGQLLVDDGGVVPGPGPNFFRLTRFSLAGGVHPLKVFGGRENLLIQQGTIALGPTSQDGVYLLHGERMAFTQVIESVSVSGNYDVPGFRAATNAATVFVNSSRSAGRSLTAPAFLHAPPDGAVPVVECVGCSVTGPTTALAMPLLESSLRAPAAKGRPFDYLNANAQTQVDGTNFNLHLPG